MKHRGLNRNDVIYVMANVTRKKAAVSFMTADPNVMKVYKGVKTNATGIERIALVFLDTLDRRIYKFTADSATKNGTI
jgi:hypothetical protein